MKNTIIIILTAVLTAFAQNATVTVATLTNQTQGADINVPITTDGLQGVAGLQLILEYDVNSLDFDDTEGGAYVLNGVIYAAPEFSENSRYKLYVQQNTPGVLRLLWDSDGRGTISLSDTLFILQFTYTTTDPAMIHLGQRGEDAAFCEIVNSLGDVIPTDYIDGGILSTDNPPDAPELLFPSDDTGGHNPDNILFDWSDIGEADTYDFQLSTNESFTDIAADVAGLTVSQYSASGMLFNREYFWRVRSVNADGPGFWTQPNSFTTKIDESIPILTSPANGMQNVGFTAIDFNWNNVTNAVNYHFQLATDMGFTSITEETQSIPGGTSEYQVTDLEPETSYYWRVRALFSGSDGGWSQTWSFGTAPNVPAAPQLLLPADNETGLSGTIVFSWAASQAASAYTIEIASDLNFTTIVESSTTTSTSASLSNFDPGETYYWRVSASNLTGSSGPSETRTFSTLGVPAKVTLVSPESGSQINGTSLTATWLGVNNALSYRLEVAITPTFSSTVAEYQNIVGTNREITGLSPGATYFWRVQAVNAAGAGEFSVPFAFTTASSAGEVTLVSPVDEAAGLGLTPTFEWNEGTDAQSYIFELASDAGFTSILNRTVDLTATSFTLSDPLEPATYYYWRVFAVNEIGTSDPSDIFSFSTLGNALEVILVSPSNKSDRLPVAEIELNWLPAEESIPSSRAVPSEVNEIQGYWVEVTKDTSADPIVYAVQDTAYSDTSYSLTNLDFETEYLWRIRSYNQLGYGPFSPWWSFTTGRQKPAVPAVINPQEGESLSPVAVNLQWASVINAEYYNVMFAADLDFTTDVFDSTISDTTYTITPLDPLQTYYWKIAAGNENGESDFSPVSSFTTYGGATTVSLIEPLSNADDVSFEEVRFSWFSAADETLGARHMSGKAPYAIQAYWFELTKNPEGEEFVVQDMDITDTVRTVYNLEPNTNYYWRVKASNEIGWGEFGAWRPFVTIDLAPAMPELAAPGLFEMNMPLDVDLIWSKVDRASDYFVEVSTDQYFSSMLFSRKTNGDTTVTAAGLDEARTYYWRVKAENSGGSSPYSQVGVFTTMLTRPENVEAAPKSPRVVEITWTYDGPSEATFYIQRAEGKPGEALTFQQIGFSEAGVTTYTDFSVPDTIIDMTYRVKAAMNLILSEPSDEAGLETLTGIEDAMSSAEVPTSYDLFQNYPNPFNPSTTIRYALPKTSEVTITVYSMLGEAVHQLVNTTMSAGYYETEWNASNLSSGIYIYAIDAQPIDGSASFRSVKKLILMK